MADSFTNNLRDLMARQHAREQVAALMQEHGDDFVIYAAMDIVERKRRQAHDAYVKDRDAARAAAFPVTSQGTEPTTPERT